MPIIKQNFELKYDDILKLKKALTNFQGDKEKTINDCLQKISSPRSAKSVTSFLPVSKTGKRHAKYNLWYELKYYNLSFVLSNSLKGKRGSSYYYLYYPATGTGNSYKKGPNNFFEKGINNDYENIVNDLLNALNNKLREELNNE